jgi:uncharacterized membrane protein YidH (DUF202 family)
MRTGLGFVALGIAVERFSQLDLEALIKPPIDPDLRQGADAARRDNAERQADKRQSQLLAGSLMGLGSGSILYGTVRYFSNLKLLEAGKFKPAYLGAAVLGASVAGLAAGVYGTAVKRERGKEARLDRSESRMDRR